jgi:chromosome partitioning protein
VLLVDTDPSANASWTLLGGQGGERPTLAEVLTRRAAVEEAIRPSVTPGLDLLPSDAALGGVNVALAQEVGRDTRLRSALAGVAGRYAFVVIDTGPQTTTLLVNALVATEEVIVPLDAGVYAVLGLVELERLVGEVSEAYNPGLRLAGLLLTRTQRNSVSRDVEHELRQRFGSLVFAAMIPLSVKVEEAHSRGLTVLDHAPKSAPALAYDQLVEEVLCGEAERRGGSAGGPLGTIDASADAA